MKLTFQVYVGDDLIRTETFDRESIRIGSLASNELRLQYPGVSRMHAVIEAEGPHDVFILDLGAPSGTFVNLVRYIKSRIIPGDVIEIGAVKLIGDWDVSELGEKD
jgi:pSer/pThr/pTyr-binding forkhead associated (FHA) protein